MDKARYTAVSASDKTDVWPFWFVSDAKKGGINVTPDIIRHTGRDPKGAVFMTKPMAQLAAAYANKMMQQQP